MEKVNKFLTETADVFLFISRTIKETFSRDFEFREFLRQCFQIGYKSLPLISVTGIIMGLVLTIQSRPVLVKFGAETMLPGMVAITLIREMGPVITALICAGKIGSGMGAELGSMKVTEQIDALESMGINPARYLAMPRVIATTFMMPVLVVYASAVAIMGCYLVAVLFLDVSGEVFMNGFRKTLEYKDIYSGSIKALFFGFSISNIGCFVGFHTEGGAQGVGLSTIKSFVICAATILILDALLWNFLIG